MGQLGRADTFERSESRVAVPVGKWIETPLFSRESEPHQLEAFDIRLAVDHVALRHVADLGISTLGRGVEYL